jgi:hypothetical protein
LRGDDIRMTRCVRLPQALRARYRRIAGVDARQPAASWRAALRAKSVHPAVVPAAGGEGGGGGIERKIGGRKPAK